jgi:signal transduction histidine kinase
MRFLSRQGSNSEQTSPSGTRDNVQASPRFLQRRGAAGSFRSRLSLPSLLSKLTVPYALLTLVLSAISIFTLTRLVTSSIRERFVNQLYEAGRVASDGIVLQETKHLEDLRIMSYTTGVAGALLHRDVERLETLLLPIVLNNQIQILTLTDPEGVELVTLMLDTKSGHYTRSGGGDLSSYTAVEKILRNVVDQDGDKYAGLWQTAQGPAFITTSAVRHSNGRLAGVLVVGTYLDSLTTDLKSRALADIVLLDQAGQRLSTTMAPDENGYAALDEAARLQAASPSSQPQRLSLYRRGYQMVYTPFILRNEQVGWLGMLLPDQFVVSTEATSRTSLALMFTFGTLMVLLVGRMLSINITRPILWLKQMAEDVATGNLQQTIQVQRSDEIGELANSFNLMTLQLRERTDEANRFLQESVQRNQELAEINTRLREMQMQLVRSEKLAAIGQLTAGIVHDVKNPLAAIQGMTDILRNDPSLSGEARQDISIIHTSALKATKIVTDLLKFARQTPPELKSQDLRETVYTALYLNRYMMREGRVKLIVEIPDSPIIALYDAVQMEQVFINLIQNAVQAMPQGGILKVTLAMENPFTRLEFIDTGAGIPPENLKRIFDPFYTTKASGTGLGLSTSYGIVASHHGEIHVQSQVGKGSRFTLLLPCRSEHGTRSPSSQKDTSEGRQG